MEWEVVIGLETHVQLATQSKIFSGAPCHFGDDPNVNACYVDLALPGALPVLNRGAVERAIQFGLAIDATVANHSVFDRKNYFYPDLPKGYQISQFELPIVIGGRVTFAVEPKKGDPYMKTINLTRAHLEEDAGKSVHGIVHGHSGIDLNRAGTPLLEIVTEPELRSAAEAVGYAKALHALVVWLGISRGNMQEGNFRCDANVSVRPKGATEFGTRCEIKNLNSFRFLEEAINYEVSRQIDVIESGGKIVQATRLYDPDRGETRLMRTKEDSMDYRYFPDPDLLPLEVSDEWIERVRSEMPELPGQMRERFTKEFGLPEYDASILTSSRDIADYYVAVAAKAADKKIAANWVMGEVAAAVNQAEGLSFASAPVTPELLAKLLARIADGTLSNKGARTVFAAIWAGEGTDVDQLIEAKGLKQISDSGALEAIVDEVIARNPKSVEEFRGGKEKALNALVGQCMKATKGKANPGQLNELLRKRIAG
ncbi:Asp-tRNA(Asn)/Glu-tRNA(Gln) amidotransferase subunit GatB [Sutterella sp.]|uniref:Asp-tRNA(Asn)/Glu-tRNA(Gln) amidotransferase subunit GatB n=1 Tax=Sutterella sp. TaxID=1981025 RepID=UPI0026E0FAAD|nr:Asp-tRNA(Asn)/Glu-tRNA(Gln) amidotransferase subunit GatB [Sutterella sp.]MDO5530408.1 Asp-tRNA(Asn)/Glu-tRNA(Gln) amidotransferase subunit GatB [Sutterella sp.]